MLRRVVLWLSTVVAAALLPAAAVTLHYVRKWDAIVSERLRAHRWDLPSKIYANTKLIYPGIDLEAIGFFDRLRDLDYSRVTGAVSRPGTYCGDEHTDIVDIWLRDLPAIGGVTRTRRVRLRVADHRVIRIANLDDETKSLDAIELEPEVLGELYHGAWEERHIVTLMNVPPLLLKAIIDVEDQHFYTHHGIDLNGSVRALWVDLRSGHVVEGGSTLTQQLAKNFFLSDRRTLQRKLREALMALIIERHFTKREILENYINEIYFGQYGAEGVYGVWEAAQFYFGKTPEALSIGEMATLAGLIRAPNLYSPFRSPMRARRRRDHALRLMHERRDITDEQYAAALAAPLQVASIPAPAEHAPYFVDFVRQELSHAYPSEVLTTAGLRIFTTLDPHLQQLAEQSVQKGLADLERRYPHLQSDRPADQLEACLIAILPQTGEIKAMVGGRDYRLTQFNRCTQGRRQPGSVFKPFTYLAAFEQTRHTDHPILPTTRLEDEPFDWVFDHRVWSPADYENRYRGMVTVRQALEFSLNAATARLAQQVGLPAILDTARRMGISSPLPPYPSVVLGAAEVSPFEIAQAYAALADGGLRAEPLSIKEVLDRGALPVERQPVHVEQAIEPDTAYLVTHLLEGVIDYGTGHSARKLGFTRPAAGKTGTTNDYSDAWFVGFTPELLTVVWVGFDQHQPLYLTGAEAALPIWTDFMRQATAGTPRTTFVPPPNVALVRIDPLSGERATPACPGALREAFYSGDEPTQLECRAYQ